MALTDPGGPIQKIGAMLGLAGMALAVGGALAFQHIGGYIPCKLCLEQRIPYYIGLPVLAVALLSMLFRGPAWLSRLLLLLGGLLMLWSLYLAVFHSGVEWGWWQGPADCGVVAAPTTGSSGGVLGSLNTVIPPACDQAALRVLGLSFAGWNAIASAVLAAITIRAAFARA